MAAGFKKAISSTLGQLGIGLGVGAIAHEFQTLLDKADELQTKADQLDVSTDFFQRWVNGSASAGVATEKSTAALQYFLKAVGDAKRGLQAPTKAFKDLGVSIEDGLSPEQIIGPVADALKRLTDRAQRASIAAAIFGAESSEFLAALKAGAAGFAALRESAKGVIDQQDLDRLEPDWPACSRKCARMWRAASAKGLGYIGYPRPSSTASIPWAYQNVQKRMAKDKSWTRFLPTPLAALTPALGPLSIAVQQFRKPKQTDVMTEWRRLLAIQTELDKKAAADKAIQEKLNREKAAAARTEAERIAVVKERHAEEELGDVRNQITAENKKQLAAAFTAWQTLLKSEAQLPGRALRPRPFLPL